jgi:hypothetical protein
MAVNDINISTIGDKEALKEFERLQKSMSRKEINKIQRRNAKPMLRDMKQSAPSLRIAKMTAITTRQRGRKFQPAAPRIGIRIGVINNDTTLFPPSEKISAPALASILEHGTPERFRTAAKAFGITIGVQSTGKVRPKPWIRPAWDRNESTFVAKTIKSYERQVNP